MATTNPVTQILVTKGNKAVLAKDQTVGALTPGQLGVFDYHTNLSVDNTTTAKEFYIAVGVGENGSATTTKVLFSAGQYIPKILNRNITVDCPTNSVPDIYVLSGFKAKCETEYGIKVSVRNGFQYMLNGMNHDAKTFMIKTGCCNQVDCTSCPEGEANEIPTKLAAAINNDPDGLFKAELLDGNTVVTNYATWAANEDNEGKVLSLRITSIPLNTLTYGAVNLKYTHLRNSFLDVSLVEGFTCNGTLTHTQVGSFGAGTGYDLKQDEYLAGGWNGKPGIYRTSELVGMPIDAYESYIDKDAKYTVATLAYDIESVGGWLEYKNNIQTIVAIPCADSTTLTPFIAILNKIGETNGYNIIETGCTCPA